MLSVLAAAAPARAYVDASPTLGRIANEASHIVVLQVDKINPEKAVVVFKKSADLKGEHPVTQLRHHIKETSHPREARPVFDWAREAVETGQVAVLFHNGQAGRVCLGDYWYECFRHEDWWVLNRGAPELSLAYCGSAGKLAQALPELLANKQVVVTAVMLDEGSPVYNFVAEKRPLQGRDWPCWRLKASLNMPGLAYEVSRHAKTYVVGMGAGGAADVPALTRQLKAKELRDRLDAAVTLGRMGGEATTALPALRQAHADGRVRVRAAEALAAIDTTPKEAVAALLTVLQDKASPPAARKAAAVALGNRGADAKPAVPGLAAALKDADEAVRWSATEALGRVGPEAAAAVPALVDALQDAAIRSIVADTLGTLGPAAQSAAPVLAKQLKELGRPGVLALARIGTDHAKAAVPFLIQDLRSGDHRVRWDAVIVVGAMGPLAKEAAPVLLELGRGGDLMAGLTAWQVDRQAAMPYYLEQLKAADPTLRPWLACSLGMAKNEAKAAVPALEASLQDPAVANVSAWALALIRDDTKAAIPLMIAALKDPSRPARQVSINALAQQGAEARAAAPALIACLKDEDLNIRASAAGALGAIGKDAKSALPALKALQKDPQAKVRQAAEAAIKAITQ
jgi:HEAT repeat protein